MNVLFLSPHFPQQFHQFCRALRDRGAKVFGVGDATWDSLSPEVRGSLDEYVHVADMNSDDALLRAAAYLTWKHGKLDRIDSLNEWWLGKEATLREEFNVLGPRPLEMARYRSKLAMHGLFERAGVPSPATHLVQRADAVIPFAERVGYPLVLKPDTGVGALSTFRVDDRAALEKALTPELLAARYVAQPFIQGRIHTFDGLVDRYGRIVFALSETYSDGVMEVVNEKRDIAFWVERELDPKLEKLGRTSVNAFKIRERFFHLEFFERPDGSYMALEANLRPPGGFITEMMNYACDFDVYGLWARALLGEDLSKFTYERKYFAGHAARRDGRSYQRDFASLKAEYGDALVYSRRVPDVFSGAMGNEMLLFRFPERAQLLEAMRAAQLRA